MQDPAREMQQMFSAQFLPLLYNRLLQYRYYSLGALTSMAYYRSSAPWPLTA